MVENKIYKPNHEYDGRKLVLKQFGNQITNVNFLINHFILKVFLLNLSTLFVKLSKYKKQHDQFLEIVVIKNVKCNVTRMASEKFYSDLYARFCYIAYF